MHAAQKHHICKKEKRKKACSSYPHQHPGAMHAGQKHRICKKRKKFLASKFGLFLSFPVYCLGREVIEGLPMISSCKPFILHCIIGNLTVDLWILSQFPTLICHFSYSGIDFVFSPSIWPKLRCSAVMGRLSLRFFGKLHGKHFRQHFSCTPPVAYLPNGEKYKQYQVVQKNK